MAASSAATVACVSTNVGQGDDERVWDKLAEAQGLYEAYILASELYDVRKLAFVEPEPTPESGLPLTLVFT